MFAACGNGVEEAASQKLHPITDVPAVPHRAGVRDDMRQIEQDALQSGVGSEDGSQQLARPPADIDHQARTGKVHRPQHCRHLRR